MIKRNSKFIFILLCIYLFVRLTTGNVVYGLITMTCFAVGAIFGYVDKNR